MVTLSPKELERDFAAYLARAKAGETLVVAETCSGKSASAKRPFGLAAGLFVVPDDFDDPLPEELLAEFEGR